MSELAGQMAAESGATIWTCEHEDGRALRAWLAGYLRSFAALKSSDQKALAAFHEKRTEHPYGAIDDALIIAGRALWPRRARWKQLALLLGRSVKAISDHARHRKLLKPRAPSRRRPT